MKNKIYAIIFIVSTIISLFSCSNDNKKETNTGLSRAETHIIKHISDTTIKIDFLNESRNVYILSTKSFFVKGNILLFHGWNLSPLGWCEQTSLCDKLKSHGYNIIIPDMGKSMYASQIYEETLPTMAKQPQKEWLEESVMPFLTDTLNILSTNGENYLIGLSTGARGAFAIGLEYNDLFKAAIVLSGDYDQTLMQDDNLMTYFYGSYEDFPERWEGEDNLLRQAERWNLPIYIGHSIDDNVVPFQQSDTLYKTLKKIDKVYIESNFPKDFQHNYTYWESETDNIIRFIENIGNKEEISKK